MYVEDYFPNYKVYSSRYLMRESQTDQGLIRHDTLIPCLDDNMGNSIVLSASAGYGTFLLLEVRGLDINICWFSSSEPPAAIEQLRIKLFRGKRIIDLVAHLINKIDENPHHRFDECWNLRKTLKAIMRFVEVG